MNKVFAIFLMDENYTYVINKKGIYITSTNSKTLMDENYTYVTNKESVYITSTNSKTI